MQSLWKECLQLLSVHICVPSSVSKELFGSPSKSSIHTEQLGASSEAELLAAEELPAAAAPPVVAEELAAAPPPGGTAADEELAAAPPLFTTAPAVPASFFSGFGQVVVRIATSRSAKSLLSKSRGNCRIPSE